jgi:hypothetical protein
MKQKIAIIILFLACLAFPQTFLSQTNSKSQKAAKTSKSKTDKGKLQAKKIIEEFIDGVFVQRKIVETFERLTLFEACDKVDEDIGMDCLLEDQPTNLGHRRYSRISAWIWRYEFGDIFYILGEVPITDSDEMYPYSSDQYDKIKAELSKTNNLTSESFRYGGSTIQEADKSLHEMEKNYRDLEDLVFERIDKYLYKENVKMMRNSISVEKAVKNKRVYYGVGMKGSVFGYILAVRRGKMRIIGLVDGI